jgi:hypothetical protein
MLTLCQNGKSPANRQYAEQRWIISANFSNS